MTKRCTSVTRPPADFKVLAHTMRAKEKPRLFLEPTKLLVTISQRVNAKLLVTISTQPSPLWFTQQLLSEYTLGVRC